MMAAVQEQPEEEEKKVEEEMTAEDAQAQAAFEADQARMAALERKAREKALILEDTTSSSDDE